MYSYTYSKSQDFLDHDIDVNHLHKFINSLLKKAKCTHITIQDDKVTIYLDKSNFMTSFEPDLFYIICKYTEGIIGGVHFDHYKGKWIEPKPNNPPKKETTIPVVAYVEAPQEDPPPYEE